MRQPLLNIPLPSTQRITTLPHTVVLELCGSDGGPEDLSTAQQPSASLLPGRDTSKSNTNRRGASALRFPAAACSSRQLRAAKHFGGERAASQRVTAWRWAGQTQTETPRASLQSVRGDLVTRVENGPEEEILWCAEGSYVRNEITLREGTDLSLLEALGNSVVCTAESKSLHNSDSLPRQNQDI